LEATSKGRWWFGVTEFPDPVMIESIRVVDPPSSGFLFSTIDLQYLR
jgi:hypothetical protein